MLRRVTQLNGQVHGMESAHLFFRLLSTELYYWAQTSYTLTQRSH